MKVANQTRNKKSNSGMKVLVVGALILIGLFYYGVDFIYALIGAPFAILIILLSLFFVYSIVKQGARYNKERKKDRYWGHLKKLN